MAPAKIIIDTDPGVDDVHALLLALAAEPEDLEVPLISVTWGNVEAKSCLRNAVATFHVIQKEIEWRRQHGRLRGFPMLERFQPTIALGAQKPLDGLGRKADYFHGKDGLGGIHESHPHLSPSDAWKRLFEEPPAPSDITQEAKKLVDADHVESTLFQASHRPAHLEILEVLAKNAEGTIDIVAVGPLTTIAQAAAADPVTFLRTRRLIVMGGAIREVGNMTPLAEFNFYADALAAARVLALTSPIPASTMPKPDHSGLATYPSSSQLGERRLKVVLFPLDITHQHSTRKEDYLKVTDPLVKEGSPLAEWLSHLFTVTSARMESLSHDSALTLHDPMCVWYALREANESAKWSLKKGQDVRVESSGQWTRGACITDERDRRRMDEVDLDEENLPERIGDDGGWLSHRRGNRVDVCVETPGSDAFTSTLLSTIFGSTAR